MKKGFGLLEVLVAALVLGFLVVGLNRMQLGNREALLRVRARDSANFVAQHVLDSLGSVGLNSIEEKAQSSCDNKLLVHCVKGYTYSFEGKPQPDKNLAGIKTDVKYDVEVKLLKNHEQNQNNRTVYDTALVNTYAKSLEATVSWNFKNSTQSIKMAKVVR